MKYGKPQSFYQTEIGNENETVADCTDYFYNKKGSVYGAAFQDDFSSSLVPNVTEVKD